MNQESIWQQIRPHWTRILLFLTVLGPGIITANVDNDAGGITTYSVAGAKYGYSMLFMLIFVTIALIVVQEMSARLAVVTGKGLADLIRESMGVKITFWVIVVLLIANLANTVSEFAGVAASLEIFGVSKYVSVPLVALGVWLLIVKGSYQRVERIFLVASVFYVTYIISGILASPPWETVWRAAVTPSFSFEEGYVTLFITVIGTTIAPWMQFYLQSSIVDKGLKVKDYGFERIDVIVGCLATDIVAAFIIIACAATLFTAGQSIESAEDAAVALGPLAGPYAETLFALGLFNASVFSAAVLPLSTAYVVCEAFGWESGVSRNWREAPVFFSVYTGFIILGAAIILLPIQSLIETMLASQTLNGVLLPVILIVILKLVNNKLLMGNYTNGRIFNILAWMTVLILIALTVLLVISSTFPGFQGIG